MTFQSALLTVWFAAHFILWHGMISAQTLFAQYNQASFTKIIRFLLGNLIFFSPMCNLNCSLMEIICASWMLFTLTLCMLGNFSCFCCHLLTFSILTFQKNLSGTLSECKTVWIQIRTDILSVLILVQTICKIISRSQKLPLARKELMAISAEVKKLTNPPIWDDSDKILGWEGFKHRNKELHYMFILGKFTEIDNWVVLWEKQSWIHLVFFRLSEISTTVVVPCKAIKTSLFQASN